MNLKINATTSKRILSALKEDLGKLGDITSKSVVPKNLQGAAHVVVNAPGVMAGGSVFEKVFYHVDKKVVVELLVQDGERIKPEQRIATVRGNLRSILAGERTALNLLTHLSGVASLTRRFVDIVEPHGVTILDTRKTTPLWRNLEKHAVACGGGQNHRIGLYDMILIKDNHIAAVGSITEAIRAAKEGLRGKEIRIEVETTTVEQAGQAAEEGVDVIMLDNMTPGEIRDAMEVIGGAAEVEVSGGVNLENVHAYAETGIDFISIGALTHSADVLDMSLEFS